MMKYLITFLLIGGLFCSCKRKDTYGYTCTCNDQSSGAIDTTYSIRVEAIGMANYQCKNYRDTANAHGKNIDCYIE